jgi:N6-L-threonylcarbamoyladenine synthase
MLMRSHFDYEIIGQTLDDAVGEAYDKAARLMGLPYPGGPEIDKRAHDYAQDHPDDVDAAALLPRPMRDSGDYNFSFSGLKTAVLYQVRDYQKKHLITSGQVKKSIGKTEYDDVVLPEEFVNMMCYAFQEAATDVLIHKTLRAAREYDVSSVLLAGGVSANKALREQLQLHVSELDSAVSFHVPEFEYCLDNGAMIAAAAAYRWNFMSREQQKLLHQTVFANSHLLLSTI